MNRVYILCVDDEPEVLEAIERDLREFEDRFPIETAESAREAREVIARLEADGDRLGAIVCDHLMPEETGVSLLVSLVRDGFAKFTRRILLTGQAGQEDTIEALNRGGLDYYLAKPWSGDEFRAVLRDQLTTYVLDAGLDPLPFLASLDAERLAGSGNLGGGLSDT